MNEAGLKIPEGLLQDLQAKDQIPNLPPARRKLLHERIDALGTLVKETRDFNAIKPAAQIRIRDAAAIIEGCARQTEEAGDARAQTAAILVRAHGQNLGWVYSLFQPESVPTAPTEKRIGQSFVTDSPDLPIPEATLAVPHEAGDRQQRR